MKSKTHILFCGILIIFGCGQGPIGDWQDPRVILISIDGFRGHLLTEKSFKRDCPNMSRLMTMGTFCNNVQSVFPSLTYPAHTSMISGVMPREHGIVNNRMFIPQNNFVDWYWFADTIKTPTLITKIREKNLVSLGVSWPVTVGATIDYMLPEIKSVNDSISTVDLVRKHDHPDRFLESAKIRGVVPENGNPQGYVRDLLLHEIFMDAFIRKRPHLSLYHMIQTDHVQHIHGKNSQEARDAFMFMDSLIGNIMTLLDDNNLWPTTSLIITGDHGFRNYQKQLAINKLFEEKGWLSIKDGKIENWRVVGLASGGSAFIRIKNHENDDFKKKVRIVLAKQKELEELNEKVERDLAVMGETERRSVGKELRDLQREVQRLQNEFKDDLNLRRNEELSMLQQSLLQEVQDYAQTTGYDLVIGDGVLYANSAVNITELVLRAMEANFEATGAR